MNTQILICRFGTGPGCHFSHGQIYTGNFYENVMNTKLNHIQNWIDLAKQTKWSASTLAGKCGVSERTLRRHFHKLFGKNPKIWLAEQRLRNANELLRDGCSVKETSSALGYKQPNNFARSYRGQTGIYPSMQKSFDIVSK